MCAGNFKIETLIWLIALKQNSRGGAILQKCVLMLAALGAKGSL